MFGRSQYVNKTRNTVRAGKSCELTKVAITIKREIYV